MTLPDEKTWAIKITREFLRDLLDSKMTPRVPKKVRDRAQSCIRHFPWPSDEPIILKALEELRF